MTTCINEFNRFSKTSVSECLMPLIFNEIEAVTTMRGLPVPQLIKLLAVLRFYGTGNIQVKKNIFNHI